MGLSCPFAIQHLKRLLEVIKKIKGLVGRCYLRRLCAFIGLNCNRPLLHSLLTATRGDIQQLLQEHSQFICIMIAIKATLSFLFLEVPLLSSQFENLLIVVRLL